MRELKQLNEQNTKCTYMYVCINGANVTKLYEVLL